MAGTHGDLFREIGALVMTAHDGQGFDLRQTSEELARCYSNLDVSAETVARALARAMAAVGVSMELYRNASGLTAELDGDIRLPDPPHDGEFQEPEPFMPEGLTRSASVVLPSGIRLAVLS